MHRRGPWSLALIFLVACGGGGRPEPDGSVVDSAAGDVGDDGAPPDGSPADSSPPDGALPDAASDAMPDADGTTLICSDGTSPCGDVCVDLSNDAANCGACGTVCGSGEICVGGGCAGDCSVGPVLRIMCGGVCTQPDADPDNCGGCGVVCPTGEACIGGACTDTCPSPDEQVCAQRFCRDLTTSISHCGACENRCPTSGPGTVATCVDSTCGVECRADVGDCDSDPSNGCETNLRTSNTDCGACGAACGGGDVCVGGSCMTPKRVFVTSTGHRGGSIGGAAAGDPLCQAAADAQTLGGTWRAWLSDAGSTAAGRMRHATVPYVLLDGTVIANDWADLTDGGLRARIDIDETGARASGRTVWTGTRTSGTQVGRATPDCDQWMVSGSTGRTGTTSAANGDWTEVFLPEGCSASYRLYCFEQ